MHFALVYLIHRAIFRVVAFFRHWYIDASRALFHALLSTLEEADQRIALRVTLRHFFEPLYQDYSIVGRILGIIFRLFRVLGGVVFYGGAALLVAAVAVLWYAVPLILLFYALTGF
jgi:hypothetical protein